MNKKRYVLCNLGGDGENEEGWGLSRAGRAIAEGGFGAVRDLIPPEFHRLPIMVRAQDPPEGAEFSPAGKTPMGAWTHGIMYDEDGQPDLWTDAMWMSFDQVSGIHWGGSALYQSRSGKRQWLNRRDLVYLECELRRILGLYPNLDILWDAPKWHPDHRIQSRMFDAIASVPTLGQHYAENETSTEWGHRIGLSTTIKAGKWSRSAVDIRSGLTLTWDEANKREFLPIIHDDELARDLLIRYRDGAEPDPTKEPASWVIHWSKIARL